MNDSLVPLTPFEPDDTDQQIESAIEDLQPALRAYIVSLLGGRSGLADVVQETNIVVWRKRGDFELGTSFKAWAFRIAYFQVLSYRRDEARRGRFVFNDELMLTLADEAQAKFENGSKERLEILKECVNSLPKPQQSLVNQHYLEGVALSAIAKKTGRNDNAVHKEISRLRQALRRCVQRKLDHQKNL